MVNSKIDKHFWKNKNILVTGHTGFKGSWLTICLKTLGANIYGISLEPDQELSLFNSAKISRFCDSILCDIRDYEKLKKNIEKINPYIIFHLAAQPLVKESYLKPLETFSTNIMGSVNILNISRELKNLKSLVTITTDKVYKNKEWDFPYREIDELGGVDPYSASKASVELVINSYRESFYKAKNIKLLSARAGNVIGGGDWSKFRLIPDAIRAWESNNCLEVRRPDYIRPWQHVLEPIYGYLLLAQSSSRNNNLNESYNFGPSTSELITVKEVINFSSKFYKNSKFKFNETNSFYESGKLLLENSLANRDLGYYPRWNVYEGIERTINWYKNFYEGKNAYELCLRDIKEFQM